MLSKDAISRYNISFEIVIALHPCVTVVGRLRVLPNEIHEMLHTVHLMVEVFRVVEVQTEFHVLIEIHSVEVIIPNASV